MVKQKDPNNLGALAGQIFLDAIHSSAQNHNTTYESYESSEPSKRDHLKLFPNNDSIKFNVIITLLLCSNNPLMKLI